MKKLPKNLLWDVLCFMLQGGGGGVGVVLRKESGLFGDMECVGFVRECKWCVCERKHRLFAFCG